MKRVCARLEAEENEKFISRPDSVKRAIDKFVCGKLTVYDEKQGGCVADLFAVAQTINRGPISYNRQNGKFVVGTLSPTQEPT